MGKATKKDISTRAESLGEELTSPHRMDEVVHPRDARPFTPFYLEKRTRFSMISFSIPDPLNDVTFSRLFFVIFYSSDPSNDIAVVNLSCHRYVIFKIAIQEMTLLFDLYLHNRTTTNI